LYCLFNFLDKTSQLTWHAFKQHGATPAYLFDHWQGKECRTGQDHEYLLLEPYQFLLLEAK
jgi:amylosucrase